jgi:type I restriction enzyme, S subunit
VSELPSGWTSAAIDELGELRLGKMLDKAKNQGLPARYLRNINVRWFHFDLDDMRTISVSSEEMKMLSVEDGDLFVCEGGEPGRCAVWRGGDNIFVYQKALHRFRSRGGVLPELLMYRLRLEADTGALADAFTGTTIKHLTRESLARFKVPVPPLLEQKRIVDKLDALLVRADACRERLDRVPAIIKRFRQSILASATNGELTRDWREAQGVNSEWTRSSVAGVAAQTFDGPFGSHLKSNDYVDSGIRVVRLENIGPLRFIETKRTYIPQEKYERLVKHTLLANDLLFSSFVDEEVRVCLVPEELSGRAINKADCFCIRVDAAKCRPMFLALQLASRTTFEGLEDMVHGATRPRINLGQLRAIQLKLPSVDEQDEVVQRSTALLELVDNLERRLGVARANIERTTPSALAKAFRGELVPQDLNEEPASELLARIGSRYASPDTKGRPKHSSARGPGTKTKAQTDMLTRKDVTSNHLTSILKMRGALTAEVLWTASQLDIDEFYDQLKDEEVRGLLRENCGDSPTAPRLLEAAA